MRAESSERGQGVGTDANPKPVIPSPTAAAEAQADLKRRPKPVITKAQATKPTLTGAGTLLSQPKPATPPQQKYTITRAPAAAPAGEPATGSLKPKPFIPPQQKYLITRAGETKAPRREHTKSKLKPTSCKCELCDRPFSSQTMLGVHTFAKKHLERRRVKVRGTHSPQFASRWFGESVFVTLFPHPHCGHATQERLDDLEAAMEVERVAQPHLWDVWRAHVLLQEQRVELVRPWVTLRASCGEAKSSLGDA